MFSVMADQESGKRQVAYKVRVADIVNNRYIKEDGWLPNYISIGDKKVSRANLLGVIVSKSAKDDGIPASSFVLDDGSGRVSLRFFDGVANVDVGDVVFVIGRPREFGAERYIVPEIIRKVADPRWVEVRKMELAKDKQAFIQAAASQKQEAVPEDGLAVETEDFVEESSPAAKIVGFIRKLDSGDGADFGDLAARFGSSTDVLVKRLLEQGDIFEVKPGRYKVLE
jgi:RPA family protein